ncbi:MAG: hypothetical protein M5U05_19000 [Anaerolineales bacterium]|nr:hypothetical protein [Anaerolineales bacterium]
MRDSRRERGAAWGARASFAALLLVCSEWIVWQTPTRFGPLDWLGLTALYLALAAASLDLIARFGVREPLGLLLVAGLYGLLDATLISGVTARDLPLSLLGRPLGAQPLAFVAAFGAFRVLSSGRATGPLDFLIALAGGLAWGVWVRWFPLVADEPVPAARSGEALAALAILLAACGVLRAVLPPGNPRRAQGWRLSAPEWALVGGVLAAALALGAERDATDRAAISIVIALGGFLVVLLYASAVQRSPASLLDAITPPRRPNLAAWLVVVVPFLAAGWMGYHLPGDGTSSPQSDLLFGGLTVFGLVWPPLVSMLIGARAVAALVREGW